MIRAWALGLALAFWLCPSAPRATVQRALVISKVTVSGVRIGRRRAMVERTGLAAGQPVDEAEIAEARARLLETGLFTAVSPRLKKGRTATTVVVHFECVERGTTSIDAIHLGHARPTSLWAGANVSDIDPFGRGFSLGGGLVTSGDQTAAQLELGRPGAFGDGVGLLIRVGFVDGNEPFVGPRDQQLMGNKVRQIFVPYTRASLAGSVRLDLDPLTHLATGLRVEYVDATVPTTATQTESDGSIEPFDFGITGGSRALVVSGLGLAHDTRDDPSAPRTGRLTRFSLRGGHFTDPFLVFLAAVEQYLPLPGGQVLRLDIRAGGIAGDAPFFERFFVGDLHPYIPERALGVNFARRRGPTILDQGLDEQRYENLAARLGIEWRIPLGSPGEIADPSGPSFPLDVVFDAGLRISSPIGVMGLSVGNLFLVVDPQ